MKRIPLKPDFQAWRIAARDALREGFLPSELDLQDVTVPTTLALNLDSDEIPSGPPIPKPRSSREFLDAARTVAVHRDPDRWNLLYRILYRLQGRRNLLKNEADPDIAQMLRLEAQVRRDLHAMQAFVRFHKVLEPGDPMERPVVIDEPIPIDPDPHAHHLVLETPTPFGSIKTEIEVCGPSAAVIDSAGGNSATDCEHFIAWYEPEHRILPLAAPFFAERFAILRWTILTPDASVSWDPIGGRLTFGPGLPLESTPSDEALEELWRSRHGTGVEGRSNPTVTLV